MNLNDITTKPYILALIIRDDGERLLLGDGTYDFKDTLQHFQTDTFANDVVELQGADGQLLAGQVRRAGTQKFIGYIGDASMSKQKIEELRRAFLMFFRKKHFYKVVYIFCDGSAIQRKRGYIVNPPTAPEMWQKFPEYSISLNFEDVNYYEYEEDEFGDEIYAHIVQIALAKALEGGLVWDAIGAVTNGITWSNILSASGEYISIDNALDRMAPLASVQIDGNATQDGTPTPDSPVDIQVVTGENVVKIEGKNLCPDTSEGYWVGSAGTTAGRTANDSGVAIPVQANTYYTVSTTTTQARYRCAWSDSTTTIGGASLTTASFFSADNTSGSHTGSSGSHKYLIINATDLSAVQLELGSTATAYEPYQGQEFEVNLGKNLLDNSQFVKGRTDNGVIGYASGTTDLSYTANSISFTTNATYRGVVSDMIPVKPNMTYTFTATTTDTISRYVDAYDESGAWISRITGISGLGFTATMPANCYGLRISFMLSTASSATISNLQLELGSEATEYQEYFTPIELAKIGTYQDRIYKQDGKWYVHRAVRHLSLPIASMDNTDNFPGWENVDHIRTDLGTGLNTQLYTITPRMDNIDDGTKNLGINTNNSNAIVFTYNGTAGVFGAKTQTTIKTDYPNLVMELYYGILEANQYDEEITEQTLIDQLNALGNAKLYVGQNNISTTTLNATPTLEIEYYTEEGAGYEWEPGGGSQNIITVNGIDNARPIWQVVGPANNPTLTNITTGQTISWQGFVPIGQTLTIDMNEMTADLAGANVFEYITGTWIELRPGNNTLVYTADGGAEADSTLSWNGVAS